MGTDNLITSDNIPIAIVSFKISGSTSHNIAFLSSCSFLKINRVVLKQPKIKFIVTNENNNPVRNAEITFVIVKTRYSMRPNEFEIISITTDRNGSASLKKLTAKVRHPVWFHQEIFFTWAYCIRKNEFRTIYKRRLTETELKNVVYVKFRGTNTSTKCEWIDNLKGFKASN